MREDGEMELEEFLLARIAEDEAVAREAIVERLRVRPDWVTDVEVSAIDWPSVVGVGGERWLAECEAKRRIVTLHGPGNLEDDGTVNPYADAEDARHCRGCNANFREEWAALLDECPTKRALALPYRDHPDYDPAWEV